MAVRPLKVEELAEVLAVDFDDAEGIPKMNPDWRWEDEEQALLTSCSSLITIVKTDESRVVQFSHFSVKEYLTSTRLADSTEDVSHYHIDLEPAHMVLAQACMGFFLRLDDRVEDNGIRCYPPRSQRIYFEGRDEYLEYLVTRIDTPQLIKMSLLSSVKSISAARNLPNS